MTASGDVQVVPLGGPKCLEVYVEYTLYTIFDFGIKCCEDLYVW